MKCGAESMKSEAKATIPRMTAEEEGEVTMKLAVYLAGLGAAADHCLEAAGMQARERRYAVDGFLTTCVALANVALTRVAAFAEITVEPGADVQLRRIVEASLEAAIEDVFPAPVDDAPAPVAPPPPNA